MYSILANIILILIMIRLFYLLRQRKKKIQNLDQKLSEAKDESEHHLHIIHAMEEVNRESSEKKKKIHSGNAVADAHTAADIMSKLSGSNNDKATS